MRKDEVLRELHEMAKSQRSFMAELERLIRSEGKATSYTHLAMREGEMEALVRRATALDAASEWIESFVP